MWNLLKKSDEECRKLQDLLEGSSSARPEAVPVEELSQAWHYFATGERSRRFSVDSDTLGQEAIDFVRVTARGRLHQRSHLRVGGSATRIEPKPFDQSFYQARLLR